MNIVVTFQDTDDQRIIVAADLCRTSIKRFNNIKLIEIPGKPRPFLDDMLAVAAQTDEKYFGWINADCQLLINPYNICTGDCDVVGLQRLELGSGQRHDGIDGFIIKKAFWDRTLSRDKPHMYIGATHVETWIAQAATRFGRYISGYFLAHLSHPRTNASLGISPEGQHNLKEYNMWVDKVSAYSSSL